VVPSGASTTAPYGAVPDAGARRRRGIRHGQDVDSARVAGGERDQQCLDGDDGEGDEHAGDERG
jgi:hypothetical protein